MEWEKQEASETGRYWRPDVKGEELNGTVLDINVGEFGKNEYTIIQEGTEEEIVTPAHTTLANGMANAKKGSIVRIVFLGMGEAKSGKNAPFLYDVYIAKTADTEEKKKKESDKGE